MRGALKESLAVVVTPLLLLSIASPTSAEQYLINQDQSVPPGHSRVTVTEPADGAANNSSQGAVRCDENGCESYTCKDGFKGPGCDLANKDFYHYSSSVLPICTDDLQENCLVSLFGKLNGLEVKAEFLGYGGGETMPANPGLRLYAATQVSLWRLPGLIHSGGSDTYAVNMRGIQVYDQARKRFFTNELDVAIHAYSLVEGGGFGFRPPYSETVINEITGKPNHTVFTAPTCVWQDFEKCGREVSFSPGTEFTLMGRVSNEIAGWFKGRMKNPVIDIQKFSERNNLLIISAESVEVARFSVVANRDTTSPRAISILQRAGGNGVGLFNGAHKHMGSNASQSPDSFTIIKELRKLAKDTSAGTSSLWSFSTIPAQSSSRCLSDKSRVLGIVTTNATVYDGTSPSFRSGFLSYKVAGMHFESDGVTEVNGTYDLVLRSDVARCLYGFNRAPISASITISGDGDRSISTTVVNERNGWLKLAAYGFTFSQKTIQVKLTQSRRTTINCVSTSTPTRSTKVTGSNPKCPTGFRKR